MIEIRKAQKEDIPYIQEKIKKYILDGKDMQCEHFWVATSKGKTVGFGRIIDRKDFFEIATLGVDYYHRRQGIGVTLLKYLVKEAKRIDPVKPVYGVTHRIDFVKKAGFKEVDDYPPFFEEKKKTFIVDKSLIKVVKYLPQ